MQIDFVSDVACPWCAVGLASLEQALARIGPEIAVDLRFQPFELNPTMGPEGADAAEYLKTTYGLGADQLARNQAAIRERGAAVGFAFGDRTRVWNTFDAHRLLHWAGLQGAGPQRALKHALLRAYHGDGRNPGARDVLLQAAAAAGLDLDAAAVVIDSGVHWSTSALARCGARPFGRPGGAHADDVRAAERRWQQAGIRSVPSIVVDGKHLIEGGQPPEVFVQALRQIAAQG